MTSQSNNSPSSRPFTVRLTPAERAELERRAGSQPLGAYLKARALNVDDKASKRGPRRVIADQASLAQLLGMLGQSDVGARLKALVAAVENGTLPLDDDTRLVILSACSEVHAMHGLLLRALGLEVSQ